MAGRETSKTTALPGSRQSLGRMKLVPGTTVKKLPWLDGKAFSGLPSSPRTEISSGMEDSRISSSTTSLKQLFYPRSQQSPSLSPSTDSVQTPGQIWMADSTQEEARASSVDILERQATLAPLPLHMEIPIPTEVQHHKRHRIHIVSSPVFIKAAEISPTQPVPKRNPFERARNAKHLSNTVEGLEHLVHEAVDFVEEVGDPADIEQVYDKIENVSRTASLPLAQQLMATSSPLEASTCSSGCSSCSETSFKLDQTPLNFENAVRQHWGSSKSSSLSSGIERGTRVSNRSDTLLLPKDIHTGRRARVDFVLRSAPREQSRGRSRCRRSSLDDRVKKHHVHHRRKKGSIESHQRRLSQTHRSLSYNSLLSPLDDMTGHCAHCHHHKEKPYGQELNLREEMRHHTFSLLRPHLRQPIARNWNTAKKRFVAGIACLNTALLGIIVGIYAGEVPRIQYMLADERHHAIIGNVVLYFGLAISTFVVWPLPLLHGRKAYILASLVLALPLQFPQAIVVGAKRSPKNPIFRTGLLVSRASTGLVLGFANVNFITVLLDLFGASLQSKKPHQEVVVVSDIRRHGGGMGLWLGIWSWCWTGSLAVGFQIGTGIIEGLTPDWGFYIVIIILAAALILNIVTPETRRLPHRRSITEVFDRDENFITRRVARGEIKLHISTEGPKYWFEEVWAGLRLSAMMCCQSGFMVLALYLGWIYAQIVLVIVLLGSLLSRDYKWYPRYVGLGVMSIAIGGLLAVPLTKGNVFSRERKTPFRTDSMTLQTQVTWTSHLVRRIVFTMALPLMGLAYTISSAGRPKPYMIPITFAGAVGFLSILAIAECHGLIMETFDTCDLQPGVNTRHRFQSMAVQDRRRRTNYSSFPRVTAGIFISQTFAFIGAAVATEVGGIMTRRMGAQASTGVTAGILLGLTILLTLVLWRFKKVQVVPNHTFGTRRDTEAWEEFKQMGKNDWRPVVIGNPSGKMRRMSVLELGGLSRWTEIRKLNYLIRSKEKERS